MVSFDMSPCARRIVGVNSDPEEVRVWCHRSNESYELGSVLAGAAIFQSCVFAIGAQGWGHRDKRRMSLYGHCMQRMGREQWRVDVMIS